jgi:hypothetical protein
MSICEHLEFTARASISRVVTEVDEDLVSIVAEFDVFCKHCGMPFKFNWDQQAGPDDLPLSIEQTLHRPWVTPHRETLCATLTIHPQGDAYGRTSFHEPGHA